MMRELELEQETCHVCAGLGVVDVGDCEDGVMEECPCCEGEGVE